MSENKDTGDQQAPQPADGDEEGIRSLGEAVTARIGISVRRLKTGETILGRYRITGELGQGGMGVVYRCFDEVSGIDVALKALPPELSHSSAEMEEVRENFQLVHKLHHPHIAGVQTLERDPAGNYYLVMECVDGIDLRRWRKQRQKADGRKARAPGLPLDEVLPILRQIAAALDYAHAEGIIHRDIKPSNVMVTMSGVVKTLDFGLAAQIHTSLSRVSQVRQGTSGTGPYMAPEQWRGQYQDAATDQYALAAMTYELLAGRLPFDNPDAAALFQAVLNVPAERYENAPLHVWDALRRGLAKERSQRFASCAEFVEALAGRTAPTGGSGFRKPLLVAVAAACAVVAGGFAWRMLAPGPRKSVVDPVTPIVEAVPEAPAEAPVEPVPPPVPDQPVPRAEPRGALAVAVSVPDFAASHFAQADRRLIAGTNTWLEVADPPWLRSDLPCAEFDLALQAPGYVVDPEALHVTIRENETNAVTFKATPQPAHLRLQWQGEEAGRLDATVQTPEGKSVGRMGERIAIAALQSLRLVVSVPGRGQRDINVTPQEPGNDLTLNIVPPPPAIGALQVDAVLSQGSSYTAAQREVLSNLLGRTRHELTLGARTVPPWIGSTVVQNLEPGSVRGILACKGFGVVTNTFTVSAGATTRVTVAVDPLPARLLVNTTPSYARVSSDRADVALEPGRARDIAPVRALGLRLTADGYTALEATVPPLEPGAYCVTNFVLSRTPAYVPPVTQVTPVAPATPVTPVEEPTPKRRRPVVH